MCDVSYKCSKASYFCINIADKKLDVVDTFIFFLNFADINKEKNVRRG